LRTLDQVLILVSSYLGARGTDKDLATVVQHRLHHLLNRWIERIGARVNGGPFARPVCALTNQKHCDLVAGRNAAIGDTPRNRRSFIVTTSGYYYNQFFVTHGHLPLGDPDVRFPRQSDFNARFSCRVNSEDASTAQTGPGFFAFLKTF
jgi:hypothetical protein